MRATVAAGVEAILEMAEKLDERRREPIDISELVLGLNCGGSDGYSGITANPALGWASDVLVANGATSVLAETPEIRLASGELVTHEQFREDLRRIRRQGHAISTSQRLIGSMSAAVPLYGHDDQVIASLYVAARVEKWTPEVVERCLVELKLASASITKRLA